MSVLTNISLSGLSIDSNDFLYCGELDVTGSLTMEPGSTLTLQPNSVSDSALSSNVALKNGNNIFTGTNNFTSSTTTAKTEANADNSTKVSTTEFVKNQGYAPLASINTFTGNSNTFTNIINLNTGLISDGLITIKRGPGDASIICQDTTSLNSNTMSINGTTASYSMSGASSGHSFFVRTNIGGVSNVLSLTNNLISFTSPNPIQWSGTDPAVTDSSGRLASTRFVNSKQTNFLTLANTWTNQQTFSRTAGNTNFRAFDSSNSTATTFAQNNNQINIVIPHNDSKFYFNTLSPTGVQSDTLIINTTTSTLNCTNPLVQTSTMPASTDSSNKTPTTAWVQSAITNGNSNLLTLANTWTNLNSFSRIAGNTNFRAFDSSNSTSTTFAQNNNQINITIPHNDSKIYFNTLSPTGVQSDTLLINTTTSTFNCTNPLVQTATMPASTDSSTKTPTTAWVQSAITTGNSNLLSANNTFSGNNTYSGTSQFNNQVTCQRSGVDIPLFIGSSSQTTYKGCQFISSGAGNYNPIVQANEYVVFGYNTTALNLSTLTLTTHSSTSSGIKISNNLTKIFGDNEFDTKIRTSRTSSPTSQCLGNIYKVECVTGITPNFFLSTWNGTTNISLYSYTFDDSTDNKRFGTYLVKVALNYENSVATTALCCNVNTSNATDALSANMQTCGTGNTMLIASNFQYNINFSYVEQVYSTKTFYLNVSRTTSGVGGWTNTSYISWTRIA